MVMASCVAVLFGDKIRSQSKPFLYLFQLVAAKDPVHVGKYIDVYHYPDGRKELRLNGTLLPYSTYDRLSEIDQGAIVDNKRLGRTLEFISLVQSKRDNTRSQSIPAGDGPSRRRPKQEGKKSQRSLDNDDMLEALKQLQSRSEDIFGKRAR